MFSACFSPPKEDQRARCICAHRRSINPPWPCTTPPRDTTRPKIRKPPFDSIAPRKGSKSCIGERHGSIGHDLSNCTISLCRFIHSGVMNFPSMNLRKFHRFVVFLAKIARIIWRFSSIGARSRQLRDIVFNIWASLMRPN